MATLIGTYNYAYGANTQANRQIQFLRMGFGPIHARVFVLQPNGTIGAQTSIIPSNRIDVEMESTTAKMRRMMEARLRNQGFDFIPDQPLTTFTPLQQRAITNSLTGKHIAISNGPIGPGGHEVVESLTISAGS